ncbi:MAG: hypothetical protein AMS22_04700 [Thiotrichales bacterium SG8_50]|nr:MAG: hypothetical protein AMS22_04700 [Thiotrichales bacterium SG8_50]
MKYIRRLNSALEDGLSKTVFDHLRNYLMCSFLLAVGVSEFRQQDSLFFDLIPSNYSGTGLVGLSCVLFCLNLYDGIRRISKYKYHLLLTIGLIAMYVVMSLRVIELAWGFRSLS